MKMRLFSSVPSQKPYAQFLCRGGWVFGSFNRRAKIAKPTKKYAESTNIVKSLYRKMVHLLESSPRKSPKLTRGPCQLNRGSISPANGPLAFALPVRRSAGCQDRLLPDGMWSGVHYSIFALLIVIGSTGTSRICMPGTSPLARLVVFVFEMASTTPRPLTTRPNTA